MVSPSSGKGMPRRAARQLDLFPEPTGAEAEQWAERLAGAFADAALESGFLPLAEQALAACPDNVIILLMAATAALLDDQPQRALAYLQRLSRRLSAPAEHLLSALALAQLDQRAAAKALLERNDLTTLTAAAAAFPGGARRLDWLIGRLDAILGPGLRSRGRPPLAKNKVEPPRQKPRQARIREAAPRTRGSGSGTVAAAAPPAPLPQVSIEIPLTIAFDVAPLIAAVAGEVEPNGAWFGLRERLARLSL